jgi:hypothetical protein
LSHQHKLTNRQLSTVFALGALAAIHILDLPGKFAEVPYLGFAYIGMIVFAIVLIERILVKNSTLDYLATIGLSVAVILGYVVNRTVGMPGATDDIGNWFEPLGLLSLFVEAWAILQAVQGYRLIRKLNNSKSLEVADEQIRSELLNSRQNEALSV